MGQTDIHMKRHYGNSTMDKQMNVIPLHTDSHQNLCNSLCVYLVHVYTIFIKKIHSLVSENMFGQKEISRLLTAGHGDSMCHHFP